MFKSLIQFFRNMKFPQFMLYTMAIATVLLFVITVDRMQHETYQISEFEVAPKTIRATKTVEDTYKTELERDRVAAEVPAIYQFSGEISRNHQAIIASFFNYFIEVKRESAKEETPPSLSEQAKLVREKLSALVEEDGAFKLPDRDITYILQMSEQNIEQMSRTMQGIIKRELDQPIRKEQVEQIRARVAGNIERDSILPNPLKNSLITMSRILITETEIMNEELTNDRRNKERALVEPVRILQGQVIVREGQLIDGEVYRQLQLIGLLADDGTSSLKPMLAIITFLLFVSGILYLHFNASTASDQMKKKALLIVYVLLIILTGSMRLLGLIDEQFDVQLAFLFPTALATMLVRLLLNERIAMTVTIITAAMAGIILQEGYAAILQMETMMYIMFGGLTSLYVLGKDGRRSNILKTSIAVACTNVVFIVFYLLMTQSSYTWKEIAFYLVAAIVSGLLSGAMTIGLLPFFESMFGILSDMKLVELSNPNHPLLKKILVETPGTYHHSVMVANLADAACESIGANGLLARVGSYYHDIGKTVRPNYFIENQHTGRNPHDELSPSESKEIIIAHAVDGGNILESHGMPKEIVDIARQHHGTSFLQFFYHKAKELDPSVTEDDFRYPGPKAQTKEIAVVSIADSTEAAVRSMKDPTPEKIANLVYNIIQGKLNDGQFDECDISVRELKIVERVICETLNGIFHNRIEYPT